jgi:carboxypeptidase D
MGVFLVSNLGNLGCLMSPQYGCYLLDMLVDYAINYTFPWSTSSLAYD